MECLRYFFMLPDISIIEHSCEQHLVPTLKRPQTCHIHAEHSFIRSITVPIFNLIFRL